MRLVALFLVLGLSYGRPVYAAEAFWTHQLVKDCEIYSLQGKLLYSTPGKICLYNDDGSIVSASDTHLRYFTNENEIKWEIEGYFHHQLSLTADKKTILALGSRTFIGKDKQSFRSDKVMVINFDGKVIHEADSEELLQQSQLPALGWKNTSTLYDITKAKYEISHFNSIYEIPKNPNSMFPEGGVIVNGSGQGIFLLSSDLKKTGFIPALRISISHSTHDVQVTPRGNLLLFVNLNSASSDETPFSSVNEYDVRSGKSVMEFTAKPRELFYSEFCGAVQELDRKHLLISDSLNGAYIYSLEKKKILSAIKKTHFLKGVSKPAQQVKLIDLSKFFYYRNIRP